MFFRTVIVPHDVPDAKKHCPQSSAVPNLGETSISLVTFTMQYALCSMHYNIYVYCALYTALYTVHTALYTVHTAHCIIRQY